MSDRPRQDAPQAWPAPMALAHLAKAVWEAEVDTEVDRAASAL